MEPYKYLGEMYPAVLVCDLLKVQNEMKWNESPLLHHYAEAEHSKHLRSEMEKWKI